MNIPPDIEAILLPPPNLSVWDFASFEIPRAVLPVGRRTRPAPATFFVKGAAELLDPEEIRALYTPPDEVVESLYTYATTSLTDPKTIAVQCAHLPANERRKLTPLWIIFYWKRVKELRSVKLKWVQAKETLVQRSRLTRKNASSPNPVQTICDALQSIYWSGTIQGFEFAENIDSLALYASREWFTDTQQTQMLDLLRSDVLTNGRALQDEICEIYMMEYIRAAWREREAYADPEKKQDYTRVRAMGAVLASGERERLEFALDRGHPRWQEENDPIRRPIQTPPDTEKRQALEWFTACSTGQKFAWGNFDVPNQKDGFNCGILSHIGLGHEFLPDRYPLIDGKGNAPADARLEMMLRIINRHLDVCNQIAPSSESTFETESRAYQFSFNTQLDPAAQTVQLAINSCNTIAESDAVPTVPTAPSTPTGANLSPIDSDSDDSCGYPIRLATASFADFHPVSHMTDDSDGPTVPSTPTGPCSQLDDYSDGSFEPPERLIIASFSDFDTPAPRTPSPLLPTEAFDRTLSPSESIGKSSDSGHSSDRPGSSGGSMFDLVTSLMHRRRRKPQKRVLSTPPTSPEKKKPEISQKINETGRAVISSIRSGMENTRIFKYFNKLATNDDKKRMRTAWLEGRDETFTEGQGFGKASDAVQAVRREHKKELARQRQQKHRKLERSMEIAKGARSPGGTKRKILEVTLEDRPSKRFKGSIAEMTRPNREAPQIEEATRHPSVGHSMSSRAIEKILKAKNPAVFERISHTTIEGWIDRGGGKARWSAAVLARAEKGNFQGHPNGGRRGILANRPDVADLITGRIRGLRNVGAPVTLVTVRALFVATIIDQAPEIFATRAKDGSYFSVSDSGGKRHRKPTTRYKDFWRHRDDVNEWNEDYS
ncbi:hypothetical protein B0H17DRAFT_1300752 [Mycena rosella]|uniref:Ubiquitin-like protease family profile domain-containing protein n=1 Tax=Mycena rosella TaxID=1033263 RepID=A0AAD7DBT2_MYCRO|nr:hypothetical protein B0H17DRAFT_1300752 [Mycena rosella]